MSAESPVFPLDLMSGVAGLKVRDEMTEHKFAVGQIVNFSPDRLQLKGGRGRFKIVRLLPEAASVLQYRVKSQLDGHERVVREDQLRQ